MALYDDSTINTTKLAMAFNRIVNRKAIPVCAKDNSLLWMLLGMKDPYELSEVFDAPGVPASARRPSIARVNVISGLEHEVRFFGNPDTVSAVTDGADEIAAHTPTTNPNKFGAGTAKLTHLQKTFDILVSDVEKLAGKELKGRSYLDEEADSWMQAYADALGTGVHSANNQNDGTVGGWRYAISDGTEAGLETYLGIDRADATNVNFQSIVNGTIGAIALADLRDLKYELRSRGSRTDMAICNWETYADIAALLEANERIIRDESHWTNYGAEWFVYANTRYVMDGYAPTAQLAMIDTRDWEVIFRQRGFNISDMKRNPGTKSSYYCITDFWFGLICKNTKRQGKLTGITY